MPFAITQSAIERRMTKALGKGRVKLGRNGEPPNFIQVTLARSLASTEDEEHVLSLVRNSLITMTRTGEIGSEFVAIVEFEGQQRGISGFLERLAPSHDDMEVRAEWRSAHNIDEVVARNADRIANHLVTVIRYPDDFITFSTSFAGEVRTGTQLTIGRARDCGLVIADQTVGTHHAVISRDPDDETWYLIDLGSVNGTTVDGTSLRGTRRQLGEGSIVIIAGQYRMEVTAIEHVQLELPEPLIPRVRIRQDLEDGPGAPAAAPDQQVAAPSPQVAEGEPSSPSDPDDQSRIPTVDLDRKRHGASPAENAPADAASSGDTMLMPRPGMDAGSPTERLPQTDGDDAPEVPDTLDRL